jgi:hypothetical protein
MDPACVDWKTIVAAFFTGVGATAGAFWKKAFRTPRMRLLQDDPLYRNHAERLRTIEGTLEILRDQNADMVSNMRLIHAIQKEQANEEKLRKWQSGEI